MHLWHRHVEDAIASILNFEDRSVKQIAPIMVNLMLVAMKTHKEDRWADYPHKMKAYRDRLQMALKDRPAFPLQFRSKRDNNMCLDWDTGVNVYLHKCHGGKNQVWTYAENNLIKSERDPSKCLLWNRRSSTVQVGTCRSDFDLMQWKKGEGGSLIVTNEGRTNCLDWHMGRQDAYVHRCHNGRNQKWHEAWTASY